MLFSPLPGVENAMELHIVGSIFDSSQKFNRKTAMQNLASISFFDCDESTSAQIAHPNVRFVASIPTSGTCYGFRARITSRTYREKKEEAGRTAQNPCTWTWAQRLRFQVHLSEGLHCPKSLVDDLRVGCHVEIFLWGSGNDILRLWRPNLFPVSP